MPYNQTETWKSIDDFVSYEVSNFGNVRSIDRKIVTANDQRRKYKGRLLKGSTDSHGYPRICLWRGNRQHGRIVHRLVVEAFLRKIGDNEEVNHLDGDKNNNHLDNLEITTRSRNMVHAMHAGRMAKKLNEDQVREIKFSVLWGQHSQNLAARFAVSVPNINAIRFGKSWRRVDLPAWASSHD